jgi:hypothetical protein
MIAHADPPKPARRLRHPPPPVDQVRVSFTPYPTGSPSADQRLFGAFAAMCRITSNAAGDAYWKSFQRHARVCPTGT